MDQPISDNDQPISDRITECLIRAKFGEFECTFDIASSLHRTSLPLELFYESLDSLVNTFLNGDGIRTGSDAKKSEVDDLPGKNACSSRSIASGIIRLASNL